MFCDLQKDVRAAITDDIVQIYTGVQHCLDLRSKYIKTSLQESSDNPKNNVLHWKIYPEPPKPRWTYNVEDGTWQDHKHDLPKLRVGEDFKIEEGHIAEQDITKEFRLEQGVYQVYTRDQSTLLFYIFNLMLATEPIIQVPTLREYYRDLDSIISAASDGESKSFAYKRMQYLEGKWNLYILLNERQETLDSKVKFLSLSINRYRESLIVIITMSEKLTLTYIIHLV
jgi:AMP deaminase